MPPGPVVSGGRLVSGGPGGGTRRSPSRIGPGGGLRGSLGGRLRGAGLGLAEDWEGSDSRVGRDRFSLDMGDPPVNEKEKMILAELQMQYEEGLKSWDGLDNKLIAIFTAAGFILTMLVALKPDCIIWHPIRFWPYVGMVILILIGLVPRTFQSPIRLEWKAIEEYLFENDENAYRQLASNYLYAVSVNKRKASCKVWLLIISMILLTIQLGITLPSLM